MHNINFNLQVNSSLGSPILLRRRKAGVNLTPRIPSWILSVLSGVLNVN